jgi:hypothetical protein
MVYEACIRWELKVMGDSSVREVGSTAQMKRTLNSRRNAGLLQDCRRDHGHDKMDILYVSLLLQTNKGTS